MIVEILIFLITSIVCYFYYARKKVHSHFDRLGIKYLPGTLVMGNVWKSTSSQRHIFYDIDEVYKAFPDERYVGYVEGTTPVILIRDPEIIKLTTMKDFDHFVNHKQILDENIEPLLGSSLLQMKGDKWRDMRTTLSPAFTGSKMRNMMPFMTKISDNIVEYLKEHPSEMIEVDDLVRRYTLDVIASTAFGYETNSLKDKENEFYTTGQGLFKFSIQQKLNILMHSLFPPLAKILDLHIFPKETIQFFQKLVSTTMNYRTKNNVMRPDMIQLLMEASKGTLKSNNRDDNDNIGFATTQEVLLKREITRKWTDNELASQVFIFFVAGFESVASTLGFAIHELAINSDSQNKLYEDIKHFKDMNGELTYDNVNQLKYLDCVVNETLRKWSPALIMDRVCTASYTLPPPRDGAKPVELKAGDYIYNLVNSLHLDPKYYPNPEVFDPERFSEENKHKINNNTFMPFGVGPRNCIGSRFALLELKVILYHLMVNFKLAKCEKTSDPIQLKPTDFIMKPLGGTFVKFELRG